jgi:hypothetical protein
MVSQCANPACSVPFRYLRDGRLFRFEAGARAEEPVSSTKGSSRRARFAWLCNQCCSKVKLVIRGDGIFTEPLVRARAANAAS